MRLGDHHVEYFDHDDSRNTRQWEASGPLCLKPVEFFADKTAFTIFALLHTKGETRRDLLGVKVDYSFHWWEAGRWYTRTKELAAKHQHLEERLRAMDALDMLYHHMAQPPSDSDRRFDS